SQGVPNSQPSQHLTFRFQFPVIAFLANPNGKFAYAALASVDEEIIVLFTIDQSTGKLTNTNKVVARFGPNLYVALTAFSFGKSGRKVWAREDDNGPHTCAVDYAYYPVNQINGQLGSLIDVTGFDCSFAFGGVAFSDDTAASAQNSFGPGSGAVGIIHLA